MNRLKTEFQKLKKQLHMARALKTINR